MNLLVSIAAIRKYHRQRRRDHDCRRPLLRLPSGTCTLRPLPPLSGSARGCASYRQA